MPFVNPLTAFHIQHPHYLALLILVPFIVLLSQRSLAGLGPVRQWIAISLRCLVVATFALALAAPQRTRTVDDQTVVFALDESDSVPTTRQREAWEFMQNATTQMRPGQDRIAALKFAGQPAVVQTPHAELLAPRTSSAATKHQTNIAAALRMGLALFPTDAAKRLVVLSDGNENHGLATHEAEALAGLGIPIDVVPLRYQHNNEIVVEQLFAPAAAKQDDVANLQLIVRSQVATAARLHLYRNDQLVDLHTDPARTDLPIQLEPGPNRFSIPVELHTTGVHRYRAKVTPVADNVDTLAINNEGRAFTIVGDAARVLLVTDAAGDRDSVDAEAATLLAAALAEGGVHCDQLNVGDLPTDPVALADCSAVILSNVSALALGDARQAMLASFVRDQGGGLIALGGDEAFSVGGYAHTPLEEILPVETSRAKLNLLSLGLVIVIDRSGSMAGEKLVMSREAAIASIELLTRFDQIGVVAFDDSPQWTIPLQPAADRNAMVHHLAKLGAGGGTNMYPALQQAHKALAGINTNLKHIILLTDGQSMPGNFAGVADACIESGITISTVAVGPDADRRLLKMIAERSEGRMYIADTAQPLPQIFARETILASRAGLFEQPFTPQLRPSVSERILVGISPGAIPQLRGHVVTAAKPLANAPLVRPANEDVDPILAYWQVGLGRTVAFTSGLWPRWGPDWTAWDGFSKVWTQAVRYVARAGNPGDLSVETAIRDGRAHVSVSAEHLPPHTLGSLTVAGQVISPDFTATPLQLQRTSAGRFEATFPVDAPGTYQVNLPYAYGGARGTTGMLQTGVVQSYSPEYRTLHDDSTTLTELARQTGGRVLELNQADAVFEPWSIRPVEVRRSLWELLVRIALMVFLLDVAVRRIAISPAETAAKTRRYIAELAGARPNAASVATLGALRGVKTRTQTAADTPPPPAPDTAAPPASSEQAPPDADPAAEPDADKPEEEGTYSSRLLRAKRRARGDAD
jgi:Ca-activated chloride channel family protein